MPHSSGAAHGLHVSGSTLTVGAAPPNGSAVVAWDIVAYDIGVYFSASLRRGATLPQFIAPRAFTLPASLTGSQGYAGPAPTAQAELEMALAQAPEPRPGA